MMQLLCHPRATPLVVVSYQDGVFVLKNLTEEEEEEEEEEEKGVICLTPDTVADVVKEVCKKCLQKQSSS